MTYTGPTAHPRRMCFEGWWSRAALDLLGIPLLVWYTHADHSAGLPPAMINDTGSILSYVVSMHYCLSIVSKQGVRIAVHVPWALDPTCEECTGPICMTMKF